MIDELTLGRKLYAFREERKISQTKVEVETGLSFGTISRIENNVINPTKETLTKISSFLELDSSEFNYLIGFNSLYPSNKDIDFVTRQLKESIENADFPTYLMDSTFHIWYWNSKILKLFNISENQAKGIFGRTYISILFDEKFKILDLIPKEHLLQIVRSKVWRYRKMISKYRLESSTIEEINSLKKNILFNQAWQEYQSMDKDLSMGDDFYLNYKGKVLMFLVSIRELQRDNRFLLVRYYPRNYRTALVSERLGKINI